MYKFLGFVFGFVVPVTCGLYTCAYKNVKHADYWLRVIFFWLIFDQIVAPVFSTVLDGVVPGVWSIVYLGFSVALLVPKSKVLELLHKYTITGLNHDALDVVYKFIRKNTAEAKNKATALFTKYEKAMEF
ncbi:uncharacterized protein BEWA_052410 [Theileria equi strain WA]|uniref:Membrane protein, putative n=1 Tax=Theileria equi strain WA TaxID=1537102 RepID=L1LCW6_THEEQ|nr:uncharacterized protein BEWA_052410 [Theileria equi strain WA]EKX73186.1 membrane protein, putative [Theileria equi strain WA]|eukprot:XP_004832638.1 uncharacterized protein BEWA_052410 [Theileria equi strain WA]